MDSVRRKFLKGVGLVALATYLPKLTSATCVADDCSEERFTSVTHVCDQHHGVFGTNASAGLRLEKSEKEMQLLKTLGDDHNECWVVKDNCLVKNKSTYFHIIRNIGGSRTGIIGLSLMGGSNEWRTRIDESATRAKSLVRLGTCQQVYCLIETGSGTAIMDSEVNEIIRAGHGINQWFVTVKSKKYARNEVRCLLDATGQQVSVSLNNLATHYNQQIQYANERVVDIRSSRLV